MAQREVVIRLEHISKKYKDKTALKACNICFEKGRIYGIVGPNGAGKTTMFGIMAGLIRPTEGRLELFGETGSSVQVRSRMSFLIELPCLDGEMTSCQNLKYVMLLSGLKEERRIQDVLRMVGLEREAHKRVKTFSLGMRQRMGIAMALIREPEVLVLDEPMNGLDPEGVVQMRRLLKDLCEKRQVTVIISSHILGELDRLADEFVLIKDGTILTQIEKSALEERKQTEGLESLEDFYLKKVGAADEAFD